jgi:probable rRNA maturation factor
VRGRGGRVALAERRQLVRLLGRAIAAAGGGEVALSLVDDEEIRALNRTYVGEDHATDVLSFSQREHVASAPAAAREGGAPAGRGLLGDVVISIDTARRQARAGKRTLAAELLHLAVHGLVHLLGYDHASPAEERVMFGYEARLRKAASAPGPVARVRAPRRSTA